MLEVNDLLFINAGLILMVLIFVIVLRPKRMEQSSASAIQSLEKHLVTIRKELKEEFRDNRQEALRMTRENRQEFQVGIKALREDLVKSIGILNEDQNYAAKKLQESNLSMLTDLVEKNDGFNQETKDTLRGNLGELQEKFDMNITNFTSMQKERLDNMKEQQNYLVITAEHKLEQIRELVDEKLNNTLNERMKLSFEQIGKQLSEYAGKIR